MRMGNYPPGVSAEDIEREFGDGPRTCGSCAHCLVRACDIDPGATGGGACSGTCEVLNEYTSFLSWCENWEES